MWLLPISVLQESRMTNRVSINCWKIPKESSQNRLDWSFSNLMVTGLTSVGECHRQSSEISIHSNSQICTFDLTSLGYKNDSGYHSVVYSVHRQMSILQSLDSRIAISHSTNDFSAFWVSIWHLVCFTIHLESVLLSRELVVHQDDLLKKTKTRNVDNVVQLISTTCWSSNDRNSMKWSTSNASKAGIPIGLFLKSMRLEWNEVWHHMACVNRTQAHVFLWISIDF
jgi:hypothetical protein